ncbi:MAG: DUF2723 domain-containing protein, partial [Spirochaetes bacterium]|nr:DUF2723 domain-containing protein [Spirochaetota bacterium]
MNILKKYVFEILIFSVIFLILVFGLYPGVTNGDSGELLSAGYVLGVAHPPGYPVYLLILKLFMFILPFSPAFSGNLMSAFFTSLSMVLLYKNMHIIFSLLKSEIDSIYQKISLLFLILSFSLTPVLLSQSIITEVYSLNMFFFLLNNIIFLFYYKKRSKKYLALFFFIYGISLTHHPSVVLILPVYIILIILINKERINYFKEWMQFFLKPIIFLLLGLGPFLYLIIRANAGAPVNWGNPHDLRNLLFHIFRIEYKDQNWIQNRNAFILLKQVLVYGKILFEQFHVFIMAGILGLILLFKKDKKIALIISIVFLILSGSFVVVLNTRLNLHIIYTSKVFYIPSFIVYFLFIYSVFHLLVKKWNYSCAIPVVIFALFINNFKPQSRNFIAYDFSKNILKTCSYESALFTVEGDNPLFALSYLKFVEYRRPDIDYCNHYGKLFQPSAEYFKNLSSVNAKELYFVSPERIDPRYSRYLMQHGLIYKLMLEQTDINFLNWYYLRTGKNVIDYMDKGLASIYFWRVGYFYKDKLHRSDQYQVYLKLCEKYGDEFIDIQNMLGKIYYGQNDYKKAGKYY